MATAGAYSGSPTEKILQWIDEVTETGAGGGSDLSCLKNGIALCQLANALMPGAIKKINTRKISMVAFMENMPAFVKFLQDGVEMEDHLIFECQAFQTDLEPGSRDADKVERCLVALGQMAEGIDGYEGKYLAADAGGAAERSSSKVKPVSDEDAAAIKAEEEDAAEAAAPKKVEKEKEKVAKTAAAEKKKRAADALIKKNEEESAKAEVKAQQEAEAAAAKAKAQEEEEAAAAAKAREEAAAAAAAAKAQADAAAEVQAAEVQAAKAAAAEAAAALEEEAAVATATAALTQEPEPSAAPTEGPIPGTDWERIADGDGDLYFSNSVMETTWEAPAEVTAAEAPGAAAPVEEPIEEPEPEIDQSEMIAAMKAKKEAAAAAKAEAAAAEAERQDTAVQLQAQPAIVDPRLQIVATDSHGGVMAGSPRGAESGGAKGLSAPTGVTPGEAIRVRSYSGSQREQPGAESATSAADVDAEPAANPRLQTLATDDDGNAFAGSPRAGGGADSLFAPSGVAPGEMVKITQRQPAVEQLLAPAPEPEPELVEEVQETTVHYNTTRDADSHDTATLAEFRNLWASGALNSDTTIYMEKTGVWERCGAHVDSLGLAILVDDDEAERRTGRSVAPAPAPAPYLSRRSEAADVWAQAEDGAGLTSAFSKTRASRDEYACARVVTDESYDDGVETRGREDCLQKNWAQMNADERRAALALGWTDESWEAASNVGWMHLWSDLTAEHREAAGVLSITSEMLATEVYVQYLKLKETADNPAIYTDQDMKELRQQADAAQEHFLVQQQGLKQQLEDKERELVDLAGSQTAAQRRQEEQIKERIKAEVAESVARDVQSRLREYARAAEAAQEAAVAAAIEKTRAEVIESRSGADQQRDYQQQMYDESLEAWGAIKQRQEQYHTEMVELQQSLKDQHELEQTVATMRVSTSHMPHAIPAHHHNLIAQAGC